MRIVLYALASCLLASSALANDSSAEIGVGGLVLTQSDAITLDKEDLYISKEKIRVDYLFTNTSKQDVKTLVAFPLPDLSLEDEDDASSMTDFKTDLKFKTTVDGKPVKYNLIQQAILNDRDVTEELTSKGVPLHAMLEGDDFKNKVAALKPDDLAQLVRNGLIVDDSTPDAHFFTAKWKLRTVVTREQIFPAGKTISVKHSYVPVAGGSVGGNWNKELRDSTESDYAKNQIKRYCVEDSWLNLFDNQVAKRNTKNNSAPYSEVWLSYVLKSGANWKGPIKDFRVVIDKGKSDSLVSFCGERVKKISATQFEVRKKDFEPKQDLNVLIVEWWKPGQ